MDVFGAFGDGFEQVVFAHDPPSGLRTIVAVYSTARGPALGGTRIWPFASEEEAFRDVLRLARAMAYKAAAANLPLGGGKAVIIGDPATVKTPELMRAYARVVDGMGGAYITTADVGSTSADMDAIATVTRHVTGTSTGGGDPSPVTAYGVWSGLRAVAEELYGEPSLAGRHVIVQGVGKVGSALARLLAEEGAQLTVADLDAGRAASLAGEIGGEVCHPDEALALPCDVLAPCALGPVVTPANAGSLTCRAIAGAANNQLERPDLASVLTERGILYAPDYVLNAGGVINCAEELRGYDPDRARAAVAAIADTLRRVFQTAASEGITTAQAADRIAGASIREAEERRRAERGGDA